MLGLGLADEALPEARGNLIRRIAPETIKAQRNEMLNDAKAMAEQTFRIARVPMIELREIAPDDAFCAVLTGSVGDAAIGFAHEPFGMFASE